MATPFPPIQTSNLLIHKAATRFEACYFPEDGFDAEERQLKREYWRHGRRTAVRMLARSVLVGDWNMGDTQTAVGDYLGLDHSCLSDALWKGEMSMDTFNAILFSCDHQRSWPTSNVLNQMNRSGYIAVARMLAGRVTDRKTLKAEELTELRYELMCECWKHISIFGRAEANERSSDVGVAIVKKVSEDPARHLIPAWSRKDEVEQTEAEIKRLIDKPQESFRCLSDLFSNWFDIFAATTFVTEIAVRYRFNET